VGTYMYVSLCVDVSSVTNYKVFDRLNISV